MYVKRNMEYWWKDAERNKPKHSGKNLSHYDVVHHKSHVE
jgi:hypothetical protein